MQDTPCARVLRETAPAACAYHNVWSDPAGIGDIRIRGFRDAASEAARPPTAHGRANGSG